MKILPQIFKGCSAIMAALLVVADAGTAIAETYRTQIDGMLGTQSYVTNTDEESARFTSDYDTVEDLMAGLKDIAIREGQEGTVIMKNDNDVFPLENNNIVLFGYAAYAPFPNASGDMKAGNDDAVDFVTALTEAGYTVNETVKEFYDTALNKHVEDIANQWTGELIPTTVYDNIYVSAPGDMVDYQINELTPDRYSEFGAPADWESTIDKANTTGIVVFARGAGEGNTYKPDSALDSEGNPTGKSPLELSDEELEVVDKAKEVCGKVAVLINSGNTMTISQIAEGGAHEVDGIAYIGVINDYQCTGIVDVLSGAVNATGALADTFVVDDNSNPAMMNFGGGYYSDYEIVASDSDSRYPGVDISNEEASSFGGADTYNGGMYIVEAEGIYVGYKYYETRYFDSIMNPESNASSSKGATQSASWNYDDEVLYSFGYGLSYLDYTQEVKSVTVDVSEDGNIEAVIAVTNNSDKDGRFLAQLYVQQPYTDYDKENLVEKSAVTFLNSAKVDVAAGATEEVTITVPSKYLASYDYKNAKTYILDAGDYYFTAAAGSHEATNNFLAAQGKTTADGMDAEAKGTALIWNEANLDTTTFAMENNVPVTNVADDADLNYWTEDDTVTYLSRADWDATYPINYNEDVEVSIAASPKSEEWIKALRNETYDIATDDPATEGEDLGLRFNAETITADMLGDVNNEFWDQLVSQITIDEALGAVIHGGSQSDVLTNVDNPIVNQNEGVCGFTTPYVDEETGKTYHFNVHSQTLIGTSFNPDLAYEWGLIEGDSGLWLQRYDIWGTGLTLRRTAYNGRNYEYISEDPMLTNRIGYGILQGCADKGIINGPKHMGFNDQEHNRGGISVYMTEQKFRETDLRGFQGGLEDADGMGVMIAFNRIGATNASAYIPLITNILRGEWNYTGLISTDMNNNKTYFNAESIVIAGVTQIADFMTEDNHINMGDGGVDATWPYLSEKVVAADNTLVEAARENLKYQLYTFANSALLNISTTKVTVWWDTALLTIRVVCTIGAVLFGALYVILTLLKKKNMEVE